jgi:hypothetical protein
MRVLDYPQQLTHPHTHTQNEGENETVALPTDPHPHLYFADSPLRALKLGYLSPLPRHFFKPLVSRRRLPRRRAAGPMASTPPSPPGSGFRARRAGAAPYTVLVTTHTTAT